MKLTLSIDNASVRKKLIPEVEKGVLNSVLWIAREARL